MSVRTRLMTAVSAHVLMLSFLVGGAGALLAGLQTSLKTLEDSLRRELKIVVVLQASVSDAAGEQWAAQLPSIDSEILNVDYTSRAKAMQRAQGNPLLAKSLVLLPQNPFPATVDIQVGDRVWVARPDPGSTLNGNPLIQSIRWDAATLSSFRSVHEWRSWLIRLSAFGFIMLLVWAFIGLYQFLALKGSFSDFAIQAGLGMIGGSLAVLVLGLSMRQMGGDAAVFRPTSFTWWPISSALMSALATFGWEVHN